MTKTPAIPAARLGTLAALTAAMITCGVGPAAAGAAVPKSDPTVTVPTTPPTVTVTGDGSVLGNPDMATISVGVEVTRPSAAAAAAAQSAAAQALVDAMHGQGVADKDVMTEGLGLQPTYDFSGPTPKVTGYTASETFAVTVHDLTQTGAIVQAAVAATGDSGRVAGVSFGLSDPRALRSQARDSAFADAKAQAAQYAALAGHDLGDVVAVSESGGSVGGPPMTFPGPPMAAAAPPPIATGQIKAEVQVTVVYRMGDPVH